MGMLLEIILVLLIFSTAIFMHEMGHAIATILLNKKAKAEIFMGSSSKEKKLKLKLGRITCYLTVALNGFCRQSNWQELPLASFKQRSFFLLGGPVASLIGFVLLYMASAYFPGVAGNILINLAGASFFLFATPLIPFNYPRFLGGGPSDGLQLMNLIKENRKQRNPVS